MGNQEAIEELRRAQGLAPKEPCIHFQLGRAHANSGNPQRALIHFTLAMDLCGARDSKDHHIIVSAQAEIVKAARGQNRASVSSNATNKASSCSLDPSQGCAAAPSTGGGLISGGAFFSR